MMIDRKVRERGILIVALILLGTALGGFASGDSLAANNVSKKPVPTASQVLITILATNDMHGGVEPAVDKTGRKTGGMAFLGGVVSAIRKGIQAEYGDRSGVLLIDSGDQFQGTLVSNYSEGSLFYDIMNEIGYDAAVPGNHAFDFGPHGWLQDRVTPDNPDQNPRGVIEGLAKKARFPLLAANVYSTRSLVDANGNPVEVESIGCRPKGATSGINWSVATRPEILQRYRIFNVQGVRVAVIGIEHSDTASSTTGVNVADLCFRGEAETYKEVRQELTGQADIFVLAIHVGNVQAETEVTKVVSAINENGMLVDAVLAAHTHAIQNDNLNGVPVIQSGANTLAFGRVDLLWDRSEGKLVRDKVWSRAGVRMFHEGCDGPGKDFCKFTAADPQSGAGAQVFYEGQLVTLDAGVLDLIKKARVEIAPIADRKLGEAHGKITRDRIMESPLGDAISDAMRAATKADIALINTGGLRDDLDEGPVTYEKLFKVLPFSNRAVVAGPMGADKLLALLTRSAQSCGNYSALVESGLKVVFYRDCKQAQDGVDKNAKLIHVETVSGEVILDVPSGIQPDPNKVFRVATLDYLLDGGSGYTAFKGTPLIQDLGIFRETLTDQFLAHPTQFESRIDGRWKAEEPR